MLSSPKIVDGALLADTEIVSLFKFFSSSCRPKQKANFELKLTMIGDAVAVSLINSTSGLQKTRGSRQCSASNSFSLSLSLSLSTFIYSERNYCNGEAETLDAGGRVCVPFPEGQSPAERAFNYGTVGTRGDELLDNFLPVDCSLLRSDSLYSAKKMILDDAGFPEVWSLAWLG